MSVAATGGVPTGGAGEEGIELPPSPDGAFASLMDALVPDEESSEAGEAGTGDAAPADGGADSGGRGDAQAGQSGAGDPATGGAAVPDAGDAADGGDAAQGADGAAAGDPQQPAATAGAGDRPATWTASATDIVPKLGELSTKLEENVAQSYQATSLEEVRSEHAPYFEALEKHPRLLVGQEVPAIGKEGMETLRDTNDAREWQEAVKSILVDEVRDRATRAMEESADFLQTVHASIELFQNNADLVPGTKDFDVELANRFATLAKPYEIRDDGKLQGYSIPVQPIIEQLRAQVQTERKATATPSAPAKTAATRTKADPPQAGIRSKAGNSGEKEDFSTLFGTIGLPNIQI